jgi:aromatase
VTVGTSAVTHRASVRAAPGEVYQLVADVTRWPVIFGPTVHVQLLEHTPSAERFTIWALVNGSVARWTSARELDPAALRVTFRQEHTMPPVASMNGTWEFLGHPGTVTQVALSHEFSTVDGSHDSERQLRQALDRNSDSELAALRRVAEAGFPVSQLIFGFEEAMRIAGPVAAAYEFIDRADEWHRRLPHVRGVSLTESSPGIQHLSMETATADGAVHTTCSVRVCAPGQWIAYKQTATPVPLLGHSGIWSFRDLGEAGCQVTARHLVLLDPERLAPGGQALADVTGRVRSALSGNSLATLTHARQFAEGARR